VLWGAAMLACLFSGFVVLLTEIPVQVPKGAFLGPKPGSRTPSPGYGVLPSPNPESRIPKSDLGPAAQPRVVEAYGKLPLSFEMNKGQTDSQVKFLSRGSGYSLFLTGNEAVLALRKPSAISSQRSAGRRGGAGLGSADLGFRSAAFPGLLRSPAAESETNARTADPTAGSALHLLPTAEELRDGFSPSGQARIPNSESQAPAVLRMKLVGANRQAKVMGLEELPGKSNYFIGNDPKKWRTNVPNYAKVRTRTSIRAWTWCITATRDNWNTISWFLLGRTLDELLWHSRPANPKSQIANLKSTGMATWWWAATAAK